MTAAAPGSVPADSLGVALDAIGTVVILLGAVLTLIASVGLLSLPDVLSRMHAATKPQTLALVLVVVGGALHLRGSLDLGMLLLAGAFQVLSAPVTAHVVSGLGYATGGVRHDLLHVDDLGARPSRTTTERRPASEDPPLS
ncbi:MAG TPA: monovalent cation/H(+) antiporter subunit G [Actinomycetospora sp.]|nr:monovalent cation/H(+) antiporter subunit G [Actinomycetospora sp.]